MKNFILISLLLSAIGIQAAPPPHASQDGPRKMEARRNFSVMVQEGDSSTIRELKRGLAADHANRGLISDMIGLYRSTAAGQAVSITTSLLDAGISAIKNATRDKRPEWEQAVMKECKFVRMLPMQMEILDFYSAPSTRGPLDPADMYFTGFGCRQYIEYENPDGEMKTVEVFRLNCKVRSDAESINRMKRHSKFDVYVDYLSFNPALCDLPNDSLGLDIESRVGFDFKKRKDLRFNVNARITSSWINQAMQVYNDVQLGEFNIVAEIDPTKLNENGVFEYVHERDKNSGKRVSVTGDCFLVPRSYVGSTDMHGAEDAWGTGQYKVEMSIAETCAINTDHYIDENTGKWKKKEWQEEWKMMKKRRPQPSAWRNLISNITSRYSNGEWISTLADPMKTYIIQTETGLLNGASASMPTAAAAAMQGASMGAGASAGAQGQGAAQGQGGTQGQAGAQGQGGAPQGGGMPK